jgi:hypothetical protein
MKLFGFSALALAIAAFAVGCAAPADGSDDATNAGASEDLTAAAATSVLDGTFNLKGTTEETPFHMLTLNADHSFVAMGGCHGGDGTHPICFAIVRITGSWKTQKDATGAPQIALKDQSGQETPWFYSLKNDVLSLAKTKGGTATKFDKDLSHLPHLRSMAVCADKFGNTLGSCGDDFACLEDTTETTGESRCLPPI